MRSSDRPRPQLKRTLWLVAACLFFAGCAATIPVAPKFVDESAKAFVPPAGQAAIYIVRENAYKGKAILFQVALDGKLLGGIAAGTYYAPSVPPGNHTITALSNENQDSTKLSVEAGSVYFIKVEPRWGMVSARVGLKQISFAEGKPLVSASSLAAGIGP
jgi:hypothetical protein